MGNKPLTTADPTDQIQDNESHVTPPTPRTREHTMETKNSPNAIIATDDAAIQSPLHNTTISISMAAEDEIEFWKAQCDKKNSEIVRLREEKRLMEEHAADMMRMLEAAIGKLEGAAGRLGEMKGIWEGDLK